MIEELRKFTPAELVTDDGTPRAESYKNLLLERFKQDTRPLYVILSADGERELARSGGTHTVGSFLKFLRSAAEEPPSPPGSSADPGSGGWIEDLDRAVDQALATGRPLLLDFSGHG